MCLSQFDAGRLFTVIENPDFPWMSGITRQWHWIGINKDNLLHWIQNSSDLEIHKSEEWQAENHHHIHVGM